MKRLNLVIICLALSFATAPAAFANGHNQVIFLAYLPDISNYGNKSASGIAVVDLHTGEVSVQTTTLAAAPDQSYYVWLTGPNLANPVYVAPVEADGHLPTVITKIPDQEYRYVVITSGPFGTIPPSFGDQIALVGVFPNPAAVAPVAGLGNSGQPVTSAPPTTQLPETGALLPDSWVVTGIIALATVLVTLLIIVSRSKSPGDRS
jgi:hypothetical protein